MALCRRARHADATRHLVSSSIWRIVVMWQFIDMSPLDLPIHIAMLHMFVTRRVCQWIGAGSVVINGTCVMSRWWRAKYCLLKATRTTDGLLESPPRSTTTIAVAVNNTSLGARLCYHVGNSSWSALTRMRTRLRSHRVTRRSHRALLHQIIVCNATSFSIDNWQSMFTVVVSTDFVCKRPYDISILILVMIVINCIQEREVLPKIKAGRCFF
jgi:hypothetical protein